MAWLKHILTAVVIWLLGSIGGIILSLPFAWKAKIIKLLGRVQIKVSDKKTAKNGVM